MVDHVPLLPQLVQVMLDPVQLLPHVLDGMGHNSGLLMMARGRFT